MNELGPKDRDFSAGNLVTTTLGSLSKLRSPKESVEREGRSGSEEKEREALVRVREVHALKDSAPMASEVMRRSSVHTPRQAYCRESDSPPR